MFIVVGKVSKGFSKYLAENNISFAAFLDDTKKDVEMGELKSDHIEFLDVTDLNLLIDKAKALPEQVEACISEYDRYVFTVSQMSKALGISGINEEAARAGTDKFYMRKAFEAYDKNLSPKFAFIESEVDLTEFVKIQPFPIILKPTNLSKSLFVTKNEDMDELMSNYRHMVAELPNYQDEMTLGDDVGIVAEEFMTGFMHTVAGFADSEGKIELVEAVGDIKTGIDIGQTENYLYSRIIPSELPVEDQDAIRTSARKAMEALKMRNSISHVDLMLTPNGPRIIEIGARPGGYRARMYELASGIDLYGAFLNVSSGKPFDISTKKHQATATIEVFPEKRGVITEISGQQKLEQLESLNYLSYRIKVGQEAGLSSQGFKSALIITLFHEDPEVLFADKAFIDEEVRVIVN